MGVGFTLGGGDVVVLVTVIVPVMKVWIEQWYGNEPDLVNVNEKDLPGVRSPEPNAPPSAVTVWVGPPICDSLFVHVTVSPTWIETELGVKA